MPDNNPVEDHYTSQDLGQAILAAESCGKGHRAPDDLVPVDVGPADAFLRREPD